MKISRLITKVELEQLSVLNKAQRLKYIRELLNDIQPKEYTKKRVAESCDGITYQGLHFLEEKGAEPREMTIRTLAEYYGIPIEALSDDYYTDSPKQFILGKEIIQIENNDLEIFEPQYEVEIIVRVTRKINKTEVYNEIKSKRSVNATANDIKELDKRIDQELQHIQARESWNQRTREAFYQLKTKPSGDL